MSDTTYNVIAPETGVPVKAWTKGVPLEYAARQQLLNAAQLPFIFKWIAAMPRKSLPSRRGMRAGISSRGQRPASI